jgi:hypothetical protein
VYYSVYATLVGSIGTLLLSLDSENQQWLEKFGAVERYIDGHGLNSELAARVRNHYSYLKSNGKSPSNDGLFMEMPPSLQTDLSMFMLADLLSKVDFLKDAPRPMLALVSRLLRPLSFGPGERVVTEGEFGSSMFFLMKG